MSEIVRIDGGWSVPVFRGLGVADLQVGQVLALRLGGHQIELNAWSDLVADDQTYRLSAWRRTNLGKAVELLDQVVAECTATDQGVLAIVFASGWRLTVPAQERPGAWNVSVGGNEFMCAGPGGEVRVTTRTAGE